MAKNAFYYMKKNFSLGDLILLIFFILLCNLVGHLSTYFQTTSLRIWYPILEKSQLTPPGFVFALIWGILYTTIGLATFLAFKSAGSRQKTYVLLAFFIQLLFNFMWSMFFFGMRSASLAFVEIIILLISILVMMKVYRRVSTLAYYILMPYLIWVLFASYLNAVIVILN